MLGVTENPAHVLQPTFPMNSTITFPTPEPSLKLARPSTEKWAATLAEERRRLEEDQENLREREKNLKEYESRLRSLQAEIEAGRASAQASRNTVPPYQRAATSVPFQEDPALQAAWEKLHRAREILEAEQNHMRDDRIAARDQLAQMKQREEAMAAREAALNEREALIAVALGGKKFVEHEESAMTRLTRAPFNMARSVFGGNKKDS
jgi:hypothetical protein